MDRRFDYIVVGAGSSGCVVAARMAEAGAAVLLIEAGGKGDAATIRVPALMDQLLDSPVDWGYRTAPQAELSGRRIFLSRGRCLGGTSAINAMVYMRGNRGDYDHWRDLGNPGWGYDDLLPWFRRSEGNRHLDDAYHGTTGPLTVSSYAPGSPIHAAFLAWAQETGLPYNPDVNGMEQFGCGPFQATIGPAGRCSTAVAFLHPAMARPNLHVLTDAQVTRVTVERGRATGVDYVHRGQSGAATAAAEVILCGGAINSPQLLLLSGIGPAEDLRALGISVQADVPGVGRNLQDHLQVVSRFEVATPVTLYGMTPGAADDALRQSVEEGRGAFHTNFCEAGAFLRCDSDAVWPDVQVHCEANFSPHYFDGTAPDRHGFGLIMNVCRPESRGEVRLHSANPLDRPLIDPRYLTAPGDIDLSIAGVRACLAIAATKAMADIGTRRIDPGPGADDDAAILAYIRRVATTIWHPVGTCRMGADPMAVTDAQLSVHGVTNLRVADASIMPTIVSGNTNAPCIMIGEKCAAMILGG